MRKTKLRRQQEAVHKAFSREEQRVRAAYLRLKSIAKRAEAIGLGDAAEKIEEAALTLLEQGLGDLPGSLLMAERAFNEALWETNPTDPGDEDDLNDPPPPDWKPPPPQTEADRKLIEKARQVGQEIAAREPWNKRR